jgi:hypothetical protein
MINFTVTGDIEIQARMRAVYPACLSAAISAITDIDQQLAAYIVAEKLSGQVLNRVTGTLQSSIQPIPTVEADGMVTGGVEQVDDIAPYGKFHEFGAYIPAMRGMMHFIDADGNEVFTMHTRGHRLPVRSFMRSALRDNRAAYEQYMLMKCQSAIYEAWQSQGGGE